MLIADCGVQGFLDTILDYRIGIALRPEIAERVCATQFERDKMVDPVAAARTSVARAARDAILAIDCIPFGIRDPSVLSRVSVRAYDTRVSLCHRAGRERGVWHVRLCTCS